MRISYLCNQYTETYPVNVQQLYVVQEQMMSNGNNVIPYGCSGLGATNAILGYKLG